MTTSKINKNPNLSSAVVISPLAIIPAMLVAISVFRIIYPEAQAELLRQFHGGLVMSFFGLLLSYGFTVLYGLPVYWLLNRFNCYNLLTLSLASMIPALVFSLIDHEQWLYYLAMAYFSVFVAIAFWLITTRKR